MEQLLTACRDLVAGPGGRRKRAWAQLPGLIAAEAEEKPPRGRNGAFRTAEVLAIGSECVGLLDHPEVGKTADQHPGAGQSLSELRAAFGRLLIRRAVPVEADDESLRAVFGPVSAGGDPFARVRHWADWFVPGRERRGAEHIPDTELRAGCNVGLLVPDHDGLVTVWRPLLVFLWYDRLRSAIRMSPDNAFDFIGQIAVARCWGAVLELLAARVESECLEAFLWAITGAESDEETGTLELRDAERDTRLLVAARCLGRIGTRLPAENEHARDIANHAVSLVLGQFGPHQGQHAALVRRRLRLARSVEGVGRWLRRIRGRNPGEWVQREVLNVPFGASTGWALLRLAPRLCATGDVLVRLADWLNTNMLAVISDTLPPTAVETGGAATNHRQIADFVVDVTRSVVPHFACDPLLATLAAALNAGGARTLAALEILPFVGPNEAVRARLEPLLLELLRDGLAQQEPRVESANAGRTRSAQPTGGGQESWAAKRLVETAAHAAWEIGSTHPDVLDLVARRRGGPAYSHLANYGELRPRLHGVLKSEGARRRRIQRQALAARILSRCEVVSVPPNCVLSAHTLIEVLRGAHRPVVRRLAELAISPRPDVAAGALELLVAEHARRANTTTGLDPLSLHLAHPATRVRLNALNMLLGEQYRHAPPAIGLARAICDRVAVVRTKAVEVAVKFWGRVDSQRLATGLDGSLGSNPEAWPAVAELWKRVATKSSATLARLLWKHDPNAWRRALLGALNLSTTATDDGVWSSLRARLEAGSNCPGGVIAWQTPRSPIPAEVQGTLAQALTESGDRNALARDIVRALVPNTPLPGVWEGLLEALRHSGRSEQAADSLGVLADYVTPPLGVVDALNGRVAEYAACPFEAYRALHALAKIGPHHLSPAILDRILERLPPADDRLRQEIQGVLSACDPESANNLSAVLRMRVGGFPQPLLKDAPQYLLAPLASRGDSGCQAALIDLLEHDMPEIREVAVREFEAAGLAPSLSTRQIERVLGTSGQGSGRMRKLLAEELVRRPGRRNFDLLQKLAADETEDEQVRAAAVHGLTEAQGWWPFPTSDVAAVLENDSSPYLRPAVVTALPAVYPDGLPGEVIRSLLKVAANWEQVGDLADRLGPKARVTLAKGLIEAICTGSPRSATAIELLQSDLFADSPSDTLARLWDEVVESSATATPMRFQVLAWFVRKAQKWLSHGQPPGTDTAWLRDRLERGLCCGGRAGAAAARVLGRLADAADSDLLDAAAAGAALDPDEHRPRVSRALVHIGYVLDQNHPVRAEVFIRDSCHSVTVGAERS